MDNKDSGLILKNYLPYKHSVVILNDRGECLKLGACRPEELNKLIPGYRVCYNLVAGLNFVRLKDIEIIALPAVVDQLSLQFLQQVLELSYLLIPVGQIALELVNLLKILTSQAITNWSLSHKRLFICYLLGLVGFYPTVILVQEQELIIKISQINILSPDNFTNFKLDYETDLFLIGWINECINNMVPPKQVHLFATIY